MELETVFAQALHISDPWFIKEIKFDASKQRLDIRVDFKRGTKFAVVDEKAGIDLHQTAYDTVQKEWRHLNFFEHECYLHARVPRLRSEDGKIRLVSPPWSGIVKGFTMLFEAYVLTMMKHMPVKPLSDQLNITDYKVWAIAKKYVERCRVDEDFSKIEAVGVDETAQKKNHNYISIFVDLLKRRTIFIEEGKSSAVITAFAEDLSQHKGKVGQIKDVSCDMSPAFIKGIKENLPNAKITFDKFHIIKIINKGIDEIRKAEVRKNPILKNNRFLFLKNKQNLNSTQLAKLEELCMPELNLNTARAYQYRENFKAIYDAQTEEDFVVLLTKWYEWAIQSDLIEIVNFAKTIKDHWDGIVEWKRSQINNGILEGLNSVIQAAKAKARGFRNFEYFKVVVYLITGKLDFTRINTYCLPT